MHALKSVLAVGAVVILAGISGCGDQPRDSKSLTSAAPVEQAHDDADRGADHETARDDHSGWWCSEHGVPEDECGQCDAKLAAAFQKKGDWCQEHDRPDSQCFICHPENEAPFIARYEAKFGKKPPKREAD